LSFFEANFGKRETKSFEKANKNFCYSLAAYCLVCYVLQIKDRHNANILLDREGHIAHIDFGFMLTRFPGNVFQFEQAPFKLTNDFMEVMGGVTSEGFKRFRKHFIHGFYALHKNSDKLVLLVQMLGSAQADLPCFANGGVQVAVN
jgi:phosphatidylinositol 4-kinase B